MRGEESPQYFKDSRRGNLDIISYYETFINSQGFLDKHEVHKKLHQISEMYFKGFVKIRQMKELTYGGWEIKATGLRNQWVKSYIIDEGYTFKIYWYNSNEFLRWVSTIIMHELALEYDATVFSGKDLQITKPDDAWYKTFKSYMKHLSIDPGPRNALIKNTIPKRIQKAFGLNDLPK